MEMDREIAKAKWLLIGLLVFVLSCCTSYREFNYWAFGIDGEATVVKSFVTQGSGRRSRPSIQVEYTFTDNENNRRLDHFLISVESTPPADGAKLPIRYTAGKNGGSRLAGRVNWIGPIILAVSLIFIAAGIFALIREANDDAPKRRRR
jgi:uncharacterized membrane protein